MGISRNLLILIRVVNEGQTEPLSNREMFIPVPR